MHASGARAGNQGMEVSKRGGLNTNVHVAMDARGMPLKILVSDGNVHEKPEDGRAD